jgi:hypothetical protein
MRLLAGDQIPAVVAACTCPTASTGHILLPSSPLMYPYLSTQYDSPVSALSKLVYPRISMWTVSLPLRCVAVWKLNGAPSIPGLVHMVQLGSKTGATLAGKVSLFLRNISHSPVSPPCDPHHSPNLPFFGLFCSQI